MFVFGGLEGVILKLIKNILSRADNIEFEKAISSSEFGVGNSVSDVHILLGGRKIEIETKAGMEFFENLGSGSNFMVQSGNSLMNVSKIEDYKVFLNPGLVTNKQAAINKVVDAWSKQGWFSDSRIVNKFKQYGEAKGFDFADGTVMDFMKTNTDWFDDIFMNNIK